MQAITVSFLTLICVATCTGRGYIQRAEPQQPFEPQMPFDSSLFRSRLASVSSANGSTLEDIMKELDIRSQIHMQQSSGCEFSAGTFGGGGGTAFNELPNNCGATIRRIVIRSGSRVDAIHITYRLSSGQDYTGNRYGGTGGSQHTININIDSEERVIGVFGKSGSGVDQLGFVTNKGRIFGPYGGCGGSPFTVNSCLVRGIFGRSGSRIDSIGFFCSNP